MQNVPQSSEWIRRLPGLLGVLSLLGILLVAFPQKTHSLFEKGLKNGEVHSVLETWKATLALQKRVEELEGRKATLQIEIAQERVSVQPEVIHLRY